MCPDVVLYLYHMYVLQNIYTMKNYRDEKKEFTSPSEYYGQRTVQ